MRAVVIMAVVLLMPLSSAAPFLQTGVDAGNSGATTDPGPDYFDLAFHAALAPTAARANPVITAGSAYVLLQDLPPAAVPDAVERPTTLWAIDLDTAEAVALVQAPMSSRPCFASDGTLMFIGVGSALHAYRMDGELAWTAPLALAPGMPDDLQTEARCTDVRVGSDRLIIASAIPDALGWAVQTFGLDGSELWQRGYEDYAATYAMSQNPVQPLDPLASVKRIAIEESSGAVALLLTRGTGTTMTLGRAQTLLISLQDGAYVRGVVTGPGIVGTALGAAIPSPGLWSIDDTDVAFTAGSLFIKDLGLSEYRLDPFGINRHVAFMESDAEATAPFAYNQGSALIVRGARAYAWAGSLLHAIDLERGSVITAVAPGDTDIRPSGDVLMAGSVIYVRTGIFEDLYAIDASTLDVKREWRDPWKGAVWGYGVGDGILVLTHESGGVSVIGTTGASLVPAWTLSTRYPAQGEAVQLDARGTEDGPLRGDLEFLVDWGDGEATVWTTEGVFEHAYRDPGTYSVRLDVRNGQIQHAARSFEIFVGQTPPTWLQEAFSPDNQETSFFILGLLITLLFAGVGATRIHRKRRLFHREMDAIDDAKESLSGGALDQALDDARQRARMYSSTGRLTEAQVALLLQHAGEARRSHRMEVLERDFGDLPHRLYRALQDILGDATVSSWERDRLREQLAAAGLSGTVRKRVEKQVDAWAAEDAPTT